jgi:hypothetical protein
MSYFVRFDYSRLGRGGRGRGRGRGGIGAASSGARQATACLILKEQAHEKVGELRVWGISLGPY